VNPDEAVPSSCLETILALKGIQKNEKSPLYSMLNRNFIFSAYKRLFLPHMKSLLIVHDNT
jgi:hypothetical protein